MPNAPLMSPPKLSPPVVAVLKTVEAWRTIALAMVWFAVLRLTIPVAPRFSVVPERAKAPASGRKTRLVTAQAVAPSAVGAKRTEPVKP